MIPYFKKSKSKFNFEISPPDFQLPQECYFFLAKKGKMKLFATYLFCSFTHGKVKKTLAELIGLFGAVLFFQGFDVFLQLLLVLLINIF